ncbi:MAG: ribosome-binding ATPase [Candidatus Atribacteria bacterium]|nr:ribosome-binding ATPase [Candidatus Atribacteria bacterium]
MGLKAGIVGLPNSGKTTLFNLLTRGKAQVANYPFCTISPNVGVVEVPDPRLEVLASLLQPPRVAKATIEFVDVAGLVEGASRGEGLGNQFLSAIRGVDAVIHVLRFFGETQVPHVLGKTDPIRDREIVDLELLLADLEVIERRWEKVEDLSRKVRDHKLEVERETLKRCRAALEKGIPLRNLTFSEEEKVILRPFQLITLKPILYLANLDEREESKTSWGKARPYFAQRGEKLLALFTKLEEELEEIPPAERGPFLQEFGITEEGLDVVIREVYDLLGLITFFTSGDKELRAWELPRGSTAPQAAGKVHTDMERGFIRAEVINYLELVELGSLEKARQEGKIRLEGKDYRVQDGDLVYFRFAPTEQ